MLPWLLVTLDAFNEEGSAGDTLFGDAFGDEEMHLPRIPSLLWTVQRGRTTNRPPIQNPDNRELLVLPE
ncbi:hypothetical protein HCN44_009931 [Aphidius gifuensis]|uniref:Uncharacterized protein n=1 Tax=Aphidius gifuensis TaxID=684658 RepID=A0A835CX24_APHGI|nr:hypothetical protein HCN44_009931 [Aphidius gifuensis]